MTIGHNSGEINAAQLIAFIERVETLNVEIKERNEDKTAVFGEAKSAGFDVAAIKYVVKVRAQDPDKRSYEETMNDLYLSAVGLT
jgi:uncharacterized protein (UPF0335 family)